MLIPMLSPLARCGAATGGGSSIDSDWAARIAASGVFFSNNFTYKNAAKTQQITNATDLIASAFQTNGTAAYIAWDTVNKLSGNGALRMNMAAANSGAYSGYSITWDGIGLTTKNTPKHQFYVQFAIYADSVYRNFYYGSAAVWGGKLAIIQSPDRSFEPSEIVIRRDPRAGGFLQSYRYTDAGAEAFSLSWPSLSNYQYLSFYDAGSPTVTNDATLRQRYGNDYHGLSDTAGTDTNYQSAPRLSSNGWYVIEVYVDQINDIVKIWGAPYGSAPTLIMGGMNAGIAPVGYLDSAGAQLYTGMQLTNYPNSVTNWPGSDTFICYSEVIGSDSPINFPGGYSIPNSGTTTPASYPPAGTSETGSTGVYAPAYFTSMTDKTWATIATSGNVASQSYTPLPDGSTGQAGVMSAWGGAVIDKLRQSMKIPAQGGHSDWSGNEVYELLLNVTTPAWVRVKDTRYTYGTGSAMDDGSPRATHGRNMIAYCDNTNEVIISSIVGDAPNGNSNSGLFRLSSSLVWTQGASNAIDSGFEAGGCEYDPTTSYLWIVGAQSNTSVSRYNPATNTHTGYNWYLNRGYYGGTAISPTKRCFVHVGGHLVATDSIVFLDLDNVATTGWQTPAAVSGSGPTTQGLGLVWHAASGAFLTWESGSTLYKLTPPANIVSGTWVWSTVSADASNAVTPSTKQAQGTYGRFNILENVGGSGRDMLVLVNAINESTYVYKLPAGGV